MASVEVRRSTIRGSVTCPPSKSYTHRAVAIASLATGESTVKNPLLSRDTIATIDACRVLGSSLVDSNGIIRINGRNEFDARERRINAENSGTTIRIATAMSALVKQGRTTLAGDESLNKRPMQPLLDALRQLGVECHSTGGVPPVVVSGGGIRGGKAVVTGDVSSQFISALLISCIYAKSDVEVEVAGEQVSKPYIDATLATMNKFGATVDNEHYNHYHVRRQSYKPASFEVPSDFSSAAMMLAAGALAGDVTVKNLNFGLPQADAKIVDILHDMGAQVKADRAAGTVSVKAPEKLEGGIFNLNDSPDLLPVVSILALKARNKVTIKGVAHTRVKETDRIANIVVELRKLGAEVQEFEDGLTIKADSISNARLSAYNDHRLFMAFCIASMLTEKCVVDGLESVDVSYPAFVKDLGNLGAEIHVV